MQRPFSIYLSTFIAIAAGLYLAMVKSAGQSSLIESIANGMGWYMISRGLHTFGSYRLEKPAAPTPQPTSPPAP